MAVTDSSVQETCVRRTARIRRALLAALAVALPAVLGSTCAAPADEAGMFVRRARIEQLPIKGPAWSGASGNRLGVFRLANQNVPRPRICDQNDDAEQVILAKALVWTRLSVENPLPAGTNTSELAAYRRDAVQGILDAIGTDVSCSESRSLAVARNLSAYIWAAELLDLHPTREDAPFRSWLRKVQKRVYDDDRSLRSVHETRPNNWGAFAGAARMSIALYLGDDADFARARDVFHGYLGNRSAWSGFDFDDDRSWHVNESKPRGINPAGAMKNGYDVDGALPDDARRVCDECDECSDCSVRSDCDCPRRADCVACREDRSLDLWRDELPPDTNYQWAPLQGLFAQMVLVYNRGATAVVNWESRALERALDWLYEVADYPAEGDDLVVPWIANRHLRTSLPTASPLPTGKAYCCTDWLFR